VCKNQYYLNKIIELNATKTSLKAYYKITDLLCAQLEMDAQDKPQIQLLVSACLLQIRRHPLPVPRVMCHVTGIRVVVRL